ncbi:hypothetical protein C5S53_01370 [Methanophagales archaeon]|jgi:hypothetical protein|nr:hypothetical protein C5S53_01370 [Methanophagales archaeon]
MNNNLVVGLNFYSKDSNLIDLRDVCKKNENLGKWNIEYLFENIVIKISACNDKVIIEDQGNIFYYRPFKKGHISAEDIRLMWEEASKLINELNLNVKYENTVNISFHAENIAEVYEENKRSLEDFGLMILQNFSLREISDKKSMLATITPIPETIPFKVLG